MDQKLEYYEMKCWLGNVEWIKYRCVVDALVLLFFKTDSILLLEDRKNGKSIEK